jgi:TRAP-type mannitol/chloroaromatic compound transport system substrate-binding protein
MDRREFLKTTGSVAAAATAATAAAAQEAVGSEAIATPAIGSGIKEFELAMPWADNGRGFGDSARRLARRIEALTDGRYRIALRTGSDGHGADLAHGTAHQNLSRHAAFAYFAGLPGDTGLAPHDLAAWLEVGGGQTLWDDLTADAGIKPLLAGHGGASPPLWSARPVASLADLEGGRIFAPGLGPDVARALGAEPVALEPQQVAEALSSGKIGFAEWGGTLHSMAMGLHTSAIHATGTGLNGQGTALSLAVRLATWERLSAGDKAAFAAAAAEEFRVSLWETQAHETMIRSTLTQAHGVRFVPFPADVSDALSRVAAATVAHIAGRDERSGRIDHSYMAFKSAVGGAPQRSLLTS